MVAPALPAAETLLGPEAIDVVRPAYASIGVGVLDLTVRQVLHEPGRSLTVRYAATLEAEAGTSGLGSRWVEPVVAAVTADGPAEGALVVGDGDRRVGLYRWPHDPGLPGLLAAADPSARPEWWAPCGAGLTVDVLTYRPGRRAVLRGRGADGDVYAKVLRPRRWARVLRRLHDLSAAGLPVPTVRFADEDAAVLVLAALPGETLRSQLGGDAAQPSVEPEALVGLLDRFPAGWVGRARAIAAPSTHAPRHAALLTAVLPDLHEPLDRIARATAEAPRGPTVPVHGDFHDDQVLVDGDQVSGLLDVDGAGVGAREDDLGTLLAHLTVMATERPTRARVAHLERAHEVFSTVAPPQSLYAQAAAAMVGLATGPYRVQEPRWAEGTRSRVALAHDLLERM